MTQPDVISCSQQVMGGETEAFVNTEEVVPVRPMRHWVSLVKHTYLNFVAENPHCAMTSPSSFSNLMNR